LNAYRTDRESASRFPLPADNRDISIACQSLDEWLWTIARHALIRTDRAHVMIAGALLGRIVEYRPSAYHKLPALAEWALADFPVRHLPEDRPPRQFRPSPHHGAPFETPPSGPSSESSVASIRDRIRHATRMYCPETEDLSGRAEPRATIVLATRDRPERVLNAVRSIRQSTQRPYRILIMGSGAASSICDELENATARDLETDFLSLETLFERSGSRQFALDLVTTEYVFYLDENAEVFPGTIDRLVADLDNHPEALAVGARVVSGEGGLERCAGKLTEGNGVARFEQPDAGRPLEDALESGPCDWVSGTAFLARRDAFTLYPLDREMAFYEDREWCYRVGRRGGPSPFRLCSDAFVLHDDGPDAHSRSEPEEGTRVLAQVRSIARFYEVHGRVLDAIFEVVPEFTSGKIEGNFEAARDFLQLVLAKGPERVLDQRSRGELALLFAGDLAIPRRAEEHELHRIRTSRFWRAANLYWSAKRRLSRLARLPRPR
jgi:GT2 family glycosyltransferase